MIDLKSSVDLFRQFNIASHNEVEKLCFELNCLTESEYQKIQMKNFLTLSS